MSDPLLEMFIFETSQLIEELENIMIEGENEGGFSDDHINRIFRAMHTIKGSSAMMTFNNISHLSHSVEDLFFYIRENDGVTPDWGRVTDLILESVDFFRGEVEKISAGAASDRDENELVGRIKDYLNELKQGGAAPEPAAPAQDQPAQPEAQTQEPSAKPAAASGENRYEARLYFQDDCKMENIRAYQIVNALVDGGCTVTTEPQDLLEDCSDEIITNGVRLFISSKFSYDEIKAIIKESIFLKSFEMKQLEDDEGAAQPSPEPEQPAAPEPAKAPEPEQPAAPEPAKAPEPAPAKPAEAPAKAEGAKKPAPAKPAAQASAGPIKQSFISVSVDKLDKMLNLVGEIVIAESMVTRSPDLLGMKLDNFEKSVTQLRKLNGEMQDVAMSLRMLPISSTFHKMHRIVRDTARKVGKDVDLILIGEETEVDKNIIDNLSDPLMHIIRNSMDHGIENPDERVRSGKLPKGRITLEAKNMGAEIYITIADDGRGMDRDKIIAKAVAQGLTSKPEWEITDKEAFAFTMLPGFSTKDKVTELSGRGVGMDVAVQNIANVGGHIEIDSKKGLGTTTTIKIPLTLAILDGMEISVGHNNYIVPTLNIMQSFKPVKDDVIIDPEGDEMVMIRGKAYPIIRLHEAFSVETAVSDLAEGIIIMCESTGSTICLFADKLIGEQQVVVKPLPTYITDYIGNIQGIGGCTIMGDGSISLIVDINGFINEYKR